MKKRKTIFLVSQLILLIIFAVGIYFFTEKQVEPISVYQFTRDIEANTAITAADLQEVRIPKTAVTSNFIRNLSEVENMSVKTDVYRGEYALTSHVAEDRNLDPLKSMDLSQYRKVVIPVSYGTAVAGMIEAGDYVDLAFVGTGKSATETGNSEFYYTKTFLNSVVVSEVIADDATRYESPLDQSEEYQSGEDIATGNTGEMAYIVVAVTPEQAAEIMTRQKVGTIMVVGRFDESVDKDINDFILGSATNINSGFGVVEGRN